MLKILFQDEYIVAINKPPGLLVHRSSIAPDVNVFAVQELRNQLDQKVSPVHRLDRKTSGVLLFAFDNKVNATLMRAFADRQIHKEYLAIVRGYTPDNLTIDYPLTNNSGKVQDAVTAIETLDRSELEVPFGKFNTSRYSLIKAFPKTGRTHQIRKHLNHLRHPIIADRPHGCNKQNRLFKEKWSMTTMLLHASLLKFNHPVTNEEVIITAQIHNEFSRTWDLMGFDLSHLP